MEKNKVAAEVWLKKAQDDLAFAKAGWQDSIRGLDPRTGIIA